MWCFALLDDAAGYLHIIEQMKELIKAAGKKSYTLVMGRPNSAKLANFPEVCYFNLTLNCFFSVHLSIASDIVVPWSSAKFLFMFLVPKPLCWIARIF